jgi:hypothetical protein
LEDNRVKELPEELQGLEVSRNGKCEWFKKKAFITRYKHEIPFEVLSKLFQDPPPPGCGIIFSEPDDHGTERDTTYYRDERSRLIAKVDAHHYVVVMVDKGLTRSGLIHLVSAWYAKTEAVEEAMRQREINGSVHRLQSIFSSMESFDYYASLPKYNGDYAKFAAVFSHFASGDDPLKTIDRLVAGGFGLSYGEAESIVHDWMFERNVDVMWKAMKRL